MSFFDQMGWSLSGHCRPQIAGLSQLVEPLVARDQSRSRRGKQVELARAQFGAQLIENVVPQRRQLVAQCGQLFGARAHGLTG